MVPRISMYPPLICDYGNWFNYTNYILITGLNENQKLSDYKINLNFNKISTFLLINYT